jgi:sugar lactone lactonase YvrE
LATFNNITGNNFTFKVNVDGITLSPKDSNFDRLYYCPLSSLNIFSVPTSVLRSAVNGDNLPDSAVKDEGLKSSQSDGLIMDANGLLFYGLLGTNGIAYFNTSSKEKVS